MGTVFEPPNVKNWLPAPLVDTSCSIVVVLCEMLNVAQHNAELCNSLANNYIYFIIS